MFEEFNEYLNMVAYYTPPTKKGGEGTFGVVTPEYSHDLPEGSFSVRTGEVLNDTEKRLVYEHRAVLDWKGFKNGLYGGYHEFWMEVVRIVEDGDYGTFKNVVWSDDYLRKGKW